MGWMTGFGKPGPVKYYGVLLKPNSVDDFYRVAVPASVEYRPVLIGSLANG